MLQGYIVDPETGKVVAVIRHGEVFRDDEEGAKIATVLNADFYDLSGNLVGRLDGPHAINVSRGPCQSQLGTSWKEKPRTTPFPLTNKKGGAKAPLPSPPGTDEHRQGVLRTVSAVQSRTEVTMTPRIKFGPAHL